MALFINLRRITASNMLHMYAVWDMCRMWHQAHVPQKSQATQGVGHVGHMGTHGDTCFLYNEYMSFEAAILLFIYNDLLLFLYINPNLFNIPEV